MAKDVILPKGRGVVGVAGTDPVAAPLPPGERGHAVFGVAPAFWRDPLQALLEQWHRHGDVVRIRMGGPLYAYLIVHPDHVRHVLQEHNAGYGRHPRGSGALRPTVGDGLLTSYGSSWLQQRRLLQPAFHRQRLAQFGATMIAETEAMLDRWEPFARRGDSLDVASEMMRLALRVVGRVMFSADVSREEDVVERAMAVTLAYTIKLSQAYLTLPLWIPLPLHRRFRSGRADLDRIVYHFIDERRQAGGDTGDLLSLLLQAKDADTGEGMTDRQVRDEVMTIFLAGHESTAVALTWAFYLLSEHPDVAGRLMEEVRDVLDGVPPTVDDLPRLPYTRAVLEETMRLYPPAWIISRMPLADDVVGGYRIPKGANLFISPYLTHRHPEFWDDPERFDPERFLGSHAEERPRFAYFPFGGGPHQCIGNTFALMEAQLILATVVQRYRLDLVPGHPVALHPLVTLRTRHGMRMLLRPR